MSSRFGTPVCYSIVSAYEHFGRKQRRGIEKKTGRSALRAVYGAEFKHLRCTCPMCYANSLGLDPTNLEGLMFGA